MIKIEKTDARIAINTTNAQNKVTMRHADFDMSQKHAKVQLHTDTLEIRIDQSQCFNESGLKNNQALMEDAAAEGLRAASEGIDRIVSEGNTLAEIESNINAIAEIAASNSFQTIDFNMDVMPKSRPAIDFIGGNVDIRIEEGEVIINTKPNKPDMEYTPGNVEIVLQQRPQISFSYVGEKIDIKG